MDLREERAAADDEIDRLLGVWLDIASAIAPGDEALGANLVQARAILTPDDEFFDMAKLVPLMEAALEADRRGETEPLLDDEIRG